MTNGTVQARQRLISSATCSVRREADVAHPYQYYRHSGDFAGRILAVDRQAEDQTQGRRCSFRAADSDGFSRTGHERRACRDPRHGQWGGRPPFLCGPGNAVSFRPERDEPVGEHLCTGRVAGDHLFRSLGLDPLLSRHHAACRALGRRCNRLGDGNIEGRIARGRGEYFCRPIRKPACRAPVPRRTCALSAVHAHGGGNGRRCRHDPCRLCRAARQCLSALSPGRRIHVCPWRHIDGEDHHAR